MNAEQLEQQAAQIISVELMRLPLGVESGSARNLVRFLVDAAVARIAEQRTVDDQPTGGRGRKKSQL